MLSPYFSILRYAELRLTILDIVHLFMQVSLGFVDARFFAWQVSPLF